MHQLQPTNGGRHDGQFLHLRVEAVPLGDAALQLDGGLKDLRLVSHRRIGPRLVPSTYWKRFSIASWKRKGHCPAEWYQNSFAEPAPKIANWYQNSLMPGTKTHA
jgi:hypothetical protein